MVVAVSVTRGYLPVLHSPSNISCLHYAFYSFVHPSSLPTQPQSCPNSALAAGHDMEESPQKLMVSTSSCQDSWCTLGYYTWQSFSEHAALILLFPVFVYKSFWYSSSILHALLFLCLLVLLLFFSHLYDLYHQIIPTLLVFTMQLHCSVTNPLAWVVFFHPTWNCLPVFSHLIFCISIGSQFYIFLSCLTGVCFSLWLYRSSKLPLSSVTECRMKATVRQTGEM